MLSRKMIKRSRRQRKPPQNNLLTVPMPPSYRPNPVVTRVYRFVYTPNTGAVLESLITPAKLCALECIATSTTNLIQIFETVKVNWVKIWGTPPQNGAVVSAAVNYTGATAGIQGNNRSKSDYSMGMTKPAYVHLTPGPRDLAGAWQPGNVSTAPGTAAVFTISINPNGVSNQAFIVDVNLSLTRTADARTTGNNVAITGPATVGGYYYLALDNNAGATGATSSNFKPDGVLVTIS